MTLTEALRVALERCGETRYAVSKATGIPESVLSRFIHGDYLRGRNMDRLADYLGMELKAKAGRKARKER
ncbi:MAG: helix-turn-helix domain-containing protein [Phycisphaeraceae bacterium]|nr:helix-turn-helix domain-containing protein [Phycisphaeraceae bacterium]